MELKRKSRVEYAKVEYINKCFVSKEETEIKGVSNYNLTPVRVPVLDRKYINKFNPELTCISLCGNNNFDYDGNKLISKVISEIKSLKDYHLNNPHGSKEHIGEYSLFQNIDVEGLMLEEYSFGINENGEYYLILWFTLQYNFSSVHKHIYWYGKKHNGDWY